MTHTHITPALLACLICLSLAAAPVRAEEGAHVYAREQHTYTATSASSSHEVTKETTHERGTHTSTSFHKDRAAIAAGTVLFPQMGDYDVKKQKESAHDKALRQAGIPGVLAMVQADNGKWGLMGPSGNLTVTPQYKSIEPTNRGIFNVTGVKYVTAITPTGDTVAPNDARRQPLPLSPYHAYRDGGKWGFADASGHTVLPPVYKEVLASFSEGIAFVKLADGKKVAIDEQGTVLFDAPSDDMYPYENGLAEYRRHVSNLNWGTVVGVFIGTQFGTGYDGTVMGGFIRDGVKRGYIDRTGHIVADSKNNFVYPMSAWGTFIENKDQTIFVNRRGETLFGPGNYDASAGTFSETLAMATLKNKDNGKFGALDLTNGTLVIPFAYDGIEFLGSDCLVVRQGKEQTLVNTTGQIIGTVPKDTTLVPYGNEKVTWAKTGKTYAIVDDHCQVLTAFPAGSIQDVTSFRNGLSVVKQEGKYGIMRTDGTWLVMPQYKKITLV